MTPGRSLSASEVFRDHTKAAFAEYALNRFNEITEAQPDISLGELYDILKSDFDEAKQKYEAA